MLVLSAAEYTVRTQALESVGIALMWSAAAAGGLIVVAVAWRVGDVTAREVHRQRAANTDAVEQWIARLLVVAADGGKVIRQTMDRLQRGEWPALHELPVPPDERDRFAVLEYELHRSVRDAQALVLGASAQQEKRAHLTLGRRMLTLLNQMLTTFDELEREIEDPDVLRPLWRLDHMATRARRFAESIAVVGGSVPRRSDKPTSLSDVISHAIAEVEQYPRVKLASPVEGEIHGRAAAGLIHLLAELIDNATNFSPPDTPVLIRVVRVSAGIAIEVDDHGRLMPDRTREQLNGLLSDVSRHNVGEYVHDGRIGMWVVATHASRIGLQVRLQTNVYHSNQAVVVIPFDLLHRTTAAGEEPGQAVPASSHPAPGVQGARPPGRGDDHRRGSGSGGLAPSARPVRGALPHAVAAPGQGTPPLPQRRTAPQPVSPQPSSKARASMPIAGDETPPPLAVRDPSRSYLAAGLRRGVPSRAEPARPPDGGLLARIAAGRRRADQHGSAGDHPSLDHSESPHALEASDEARHPGE
ncbi:ATP-binding protein [Streptomyces sp. T028]|uniref:ATP-binding protein n=1 Tax=Streptomyces sp. T028 TaxID=3394379 RepID=UPI003A8BB19E